MQRLLITIPLLVVMLPGCGNTPTDLTGPGDGTLGSTVVDSDGDGFSDDVENNSNPGTDPFDATDNPNNVRDSDGDGCSDYDELNSDGFCDNDPNSPVSGPCDVRFYNSDFGYGFDLPIGADLTNLDDKQNFLFNASWALDAGPDTVHIHTLVQDLSGTEPVSLADFVELLYSSEKDNGYVFLTETPITLSNGDTGSLSIIVAGGESAIPVVMYRVITIKHGGRTYVVSGTEAEEYLTASTDALLTDIVLSLCVGNLGPGDPIPPEVRAACATGADDALASLIVAVETDRAHGFTKEEILEAAVITCEGGLCTGDLVCFETCFVCTETIVNLVYR